MKDDNKFIELEHKVTELAKQMRKKWRWLNGTIIENGSGFRGN